MLKGIEGSNTGFLADLSRIENRISQTNKQITSGVRINQASDDPFAIASILNYQNEINQITQIQSNLNLAKNDAQTADGALQTASSIMNQLLSLAAQGANGVTTASTRFTLGQQVQQLGQQLVSIANTAVGGRYIFGGDNPGVQPYSVSTPASNLNDPSALFDIGTAIDSESFTIAYTDSLGAVQSTTVSVPATATGISGASFVSQINSALTTNGVVSVAAQIGADGTLQFTGSNVLLVIHTQTTGVTNAVAANNASLTEGVIQNNTAANTSVLANASGGTIIPGITAQQIFDAKNSGGTPASNNVFQAVYSLAQALLNNNQTGIENGVTAIKSAAAQISQATARYGNTETWIAQASEDASARLTDLRQALSAERDTDVAAAATQLTTDQTALEASLSAHSILNHKSLFSYFG